MTYRIQGLDPSPFLPLAGLAAHQLARLGAVRMVADKTPGFPCRITLNDAEPGQPLLLVNHVSLEANTPYRASHAIFVTEGQTRPALYEGEIPPALQRRALSLRAFDEAGMMVDAALVQPGEAELQILRMLDDARIHQIHAHNAVRGCFAARIGRL